MNLKVFVYSYLFYFILTNTLAWELLLVMMKWQRKDLNFHGKQLENWTKYMKQLFPDFEQQTCRSSSLGGKKMRWALWTTQLSTWRQLMGCRCQRGKPESPGAQLRWGWSAELREPPAGSVGVKLHRERQLQRKRPPEICIRVSSSPSWVPGCTCLFYGNHDARHWNYREI